MQVEHVFEKCLQLWERECPELLAHFREVKPEVIEPEAFIRSYLWVLSGLDFCSADGTYEKLVNCYSPVVLSLSDQDLKEDLNWKWKAVSSRIAGSIFDFAKHECVCALIRVMVDAWRNHDEKVSLSSIDFSKTTIEWWYSLTRIFLHPERLWMLPGIDSPKRHQDLCSHLGFDVPPYNEGVAKLAEQAGFDSSLLLCSYLSGLYDEKVSVVGLVLTSHDEVGSNEDCH